MTQHAEPWDTRIGVPESFVAAPSADAGELPGGAAYGPMIDELRRLLDSLAAALPPASLSGLLESEFARMRRLLEGHEVDERDQAFGHRVDLLGRGQVMAPAFAMTERREDAVEGTVRFGRYFLGGNGAVHGGAIALLFDEVLGRLSDTSSQVGRRPPGRTANLTVDFRAITPIDRTLRVRAWFAEELGRKRLLVGEIWDGQVLCAQARALFIGLQAGQD